MHIGWNGMEWKDGYRDTYLPPKGRKGDGISAGRINGTLDVFRCARNMDGWMDGWMDSVYQGTDGVIHGLDWMVPWGWVFRPGLEVNNTPQNKIFVHKVGNWIGLDWIIAVRCGGSVLLSQNLPTGWTTWL
jgi:hypothetical protein